MPPIVWRPGELYSYSSHSTASLVEKDLRSSSSNISTKHPTTALDAFLQPPPPPLADDLAVGYQYQNGSRPVPFLYLNIAPAAALSTTATDMARL